MPKPRLSNPWHLLAFGFGSGLAPKAPGTFGTLAAVPFYLLLLQLSFPLYIVVIVIASLAGIAICGKASRDLGVHDHPGIVWDEFCGFWITMIAAPAGWLWIAVGFALFRLFDIWKPWPISLADKHVDGGIGIMLDDLIAGAYAFLALQGIALLV
ncbi:phosphatidylglycerophosphatase A [Sansalvadorimonas sp. 2012CJ34-2]|uniref:Phosphatidylglycerophosphatase A n=1 Tax=Parendozoicomonas callyspongiae TaxID=2942213 RepID=A0ABT0PKM3_9GAMM|nr:phosphatidylglycerophosphatase A [Sansalvadorimonas sp. 2012CJ34-2]MCL6271904.1 phosphatidylglycerophosphatase A [Sansalvadorimonas sp. 2012CJ34-2]